MPTDPIDPRTHAVLSGISRVAVLEVLRAGAGPMTADAIAALVGLHPNTVRSHLDRLIEVGLATEATELRDRPGRPRLLFRAAPPPEDAPEDSYRVLAGILAEGLASAAPTGAEAAAAAGNRWGRRLTRGAADEADADAATPTIPGSAQALARVVAILDQVGFSPRLGRSDAVESAGDAVEAAEATVVIELHRCPFIDVARSQADIVCSVHRGLIEGALERLGAPFGRVTLEPFARPGVCLAHLESRPRKASLPLVQVE